MKFEVKHHPTLRACSFVLTPRGSAQFYGKDHAEEAATFCDGMQQRFPDRAERPSCPQCGDLATYQTPDGTYWDGNAHFWRVSEVPVQLSI